MNMLVITHHDVPIGGLHDVSIGWSLKREEKSSYPGPFSGPFFKISVSPSTPAVARHQGIRMFTSVSPSLYTCNFIIYNILSYYNLLTFIDFKNKNIPKNKIKIWFVCSL